MSLLKNCDFLDAAPCPYDDLCKSSPCKHSLVFDPDFLADMKDLLEDPGFHSDMWWGFWFPDLLESLAAKDITRLTANNARCRRIERKREKLDNEWDKRYQELYGEFIFDDASRPIPFTAKEEETLEKNFQRVCREMGDDWDNEYFLFRKMATWPSERRQLPARRNPRRKAAGKYASPAR
jgi:hypothetical protein